MIEHWYDDGNLVGAIVFAVAGPAFFSLCYFRPEWASRIWRGFPFLGRLGQRGWRVMAWVWLIGGLSQSITFLARYFSN